MFVKAKKNLSCKYLPIYRTMDKSRKLFDDYKKLLGLREHVWRDHMLLLLEDDKYNIEIKDPIDLPIPMQDGKTKIEPGSYEVELSHDKASYIWTNPETKEQVTFPVSLINKPEEPAEEEQGLPGSDVGGQEVNPLAPQEMGFPPPPEQQV